MKGHEIAEKFQTRSVRPSCSDGNASLASSLPCPCLESRVAATLMSHDNGHEYEHWSARKAWFGAQLVRMEK
jgi:hypothetical protein